MKKVLLVFLMLFAVIYPISVDAATVDFSGYYCDAKQDLGDGTFYMTCHIVVTSTKEINKVEGTLILRNVTLESIKTNDDWTSNNGLSSEVSFTAASGHTGTYTVADLVFTGDLSAEECEASFMPDVADYIEPEEPQDFVCMIVDDVYYGENGTAVSEEEYMEQCCNYTCTIVDDKYYFNSKGQSVTYDEMMEDCSTTEVVVEPEVPTDDGLVENPQTGFNYGYIMLPIGIVSIIVIVKVARKNTKIYKI